MFANPKRIVLALTVVGAINSASAYSLSLQDFDTWQTTALGYNPNDEHFAGPANQFRGEEYRWSVKTIYYAYDISFLNFFGAHGTNAVGQAFAVLNALPPASQMSSNLAEYPLDTLRVNYRASALNLIDLKSKVITTLLEQSGVGTGIDWIWCLRARTILTNPDRTNYTVIKRNYDPVTHEPSSYVNGVLYTYVIEEFQNPDYSDAVEIQVDPLQVTSIPVASLAGSLTVGTYFTGLTRDDIGAWRRLYENSPMLLRNHVESLPAEVTADGNSSPWIPYPGATNAATLVADGIRGGLDKIEFKSANYDPYLGVFVVGLTNKWDDYFRTNIFSPVQMQKVQRAVNTPDILFIADDLGVDADGDPILSARTDTANWVNNSALNGQSGAAGPGVISGPIQLTFNPIGPYFINQNPYLLTEANQYSLGYSWGSFDGTTNDPVVYPSWASLQQLQMQAIYSDGNVWLPNPNATTNTATVQPVDQAAGGTGGTGGTGDTGGN